ncbi:lysine exporter LysO family protein [Suttonella sp. R2A3]|uniref:lysine exporter LysO family protein n=1 Tax=Suttonella sp. R2A3 TaxID=2908648 RepID=UPI001F26E7B4|nr:lysine exporter LysO family protein [Suttonella sp. R2A3]UJF24137.1 lysine exporter LysO family protein [Suttonella sp. R2A3]
MTVLATLAPIIAAVILGAIAAKIIPTRLAHRLIAAVGPLVWVLLFLIGRDFGDVLANAGALGKALRSAAWFTLFSTLIPAALIAWFFDHQEPKQRPRSAVSISRLWPPLRSCFLALLMVALGALTHLLPFDELPLPSINAVLLLMVFLVGIDLYHLGLKIHHFHPRIFLLPLSIIIGALIGGLITAWWIDMPIRQALALVSGFGWFTLSSVMVGEQLGTFYGTTALLIDLTRELLGIVLLYLLGVRYGYMAMSVSGAGAMDTVLPIVKQACGAEKVPQALASGILLSLLAPVFLSLFLA